LVHPVAMSENPAFEQPLYVETLHHHREHTYVAVQGDAVYRHPTRLIDIWNNYGDIPDVPDPALLNDNDQDAVPNVSLRKLRLLELIPGTTKKFRLAAGPAGLVNAIPATWGQTGPVAGSVLPTLETPPSPATGYTPVITDADGVNHPLVASEWILDFANSYVEFPNGIPENPDGTSQYPQPLSLTWFQYVGPFGGMAVAPPSFPWIETADASGTTLHRDPAFPVSATADLAFPTTTTEGAGSRFMFDESQAAFRAGSVTGAQWNVANRGANSFASGLDTTASGAAAWAGGAGSTASDANSFVWSDSTARASTAPNEVTFGAAGGFRVLAGGAAGSLINLDGPVTMPGKLTVGGVIDPTGLVVVEQASVPQAPLAGDGVFWARDDTPNVPMYTDDAGTDHVLAFLDSVTLASAGGTETLVQDSTGPTLATKGLTAGAGITLTGAANEVTISNASPGSSVTLSSAGGAETLVQDGTGPTLATKGLTAGVGVSLTGAANDVTIANTSPATSVSLSSAGGTETLVVDGTGPTLSNKGLTAGIGVSLTGAANDVTIEATGTNITLSSAGGTETLVQDGTGPTLATKGLTAGTGISLTGAANDVTVENTSPASSVTLASAGGTETLVVDGTGPTLTNKGLTAGTGISLTGAANDVTIEATGTNITLSSAGGTETLVQDGTGPTLANKGLTAGTGISLTGAASDVTIANTSPASSVTLASAGGTETLVVDGTGPDLTNKGLTAGAGISLTGAANDVTIANTSPASSVTLASAGGTETLVQDGTGPTLATKGLTAGAGITLTGAANDITIAATGGGVTLSSAGGTESLVQDGTGPTLANKGLTAGTGISLTGAANDVTIANTSPASSVTLASAGGTETLVVDGAGPTLSNKGLTAGTGISLTGAANDVTIANTSPASSVTLASAGGTETLVVDGTGPTLSNKGLTAGAGISLTGGANDVTVAATGANITLSSAGGTETLVNDGTGPTLATKGLTAGTAISLTGGANQVTINSLGTNVTLSSAGGTSLITDGAGPALTIKGLTAGDGMNVNSNANDLEIEAESYQGTNNIVPIYVTTGSSDQVNAITSGHNNTLTAEAEGGTISASSGCILEGRVAGASGGARNCGIYACVDSRLVGERCTSSLIGASEGCAIRTEDSISGDGGDGDECVVLGSTTCFIGASAIGSGNTAGTNCGIYSCLNSYMDSAGQDNCVMIGARNLELTGTITRSAWLGGDNHTCAVSASDSAWIAGDSNDATSGDATRSAWVGGNNNELTGNATNTVCLGGFSNDVSNTVESCAWLGGHNNVTDGDMEHTIVLGSDTTAGHDGCFLFSDSNGGTSLQTTVNHQFLARCTGGATFFTNTANTAGVSLAAGGGAWVSVCDENLKNLHHRLDGREVLRSLENVDIWEFDYAEGDTDAIYRGPTAQAWHAAFPSGSKDPLKIDTMDPTGISLAAVKGLYTLAQEQAEQLRAQGEKIRALERALI